MENKSMSFVDFIIRIIVKSVFYDVQNNCVRLDDITVSNDEIELIVSEGERYGYDRIQTMEILNSLSEKISFSPGIKINYSTVDINKLGNGVSFKIYFNIPESGEQNVDVIHLHDRFFFVLASTIGSIRYADIIESVNSVWQPSYSVDFIVVRNGERYPDLKSFLRVGNLLRLEEYIPSYVYQKIDDMAIREESEIANFSFSDVFRDLLNKIRESISSSTLKEVYYSILGIWKSLGGNSYTLSLVIAKELDRKNALLPLSDDRSYYYEFKYDNIDDSIPNNSIKRKIRLRYVNVNILWIIILFLFISLLISRQQYNATVDSRDKLTDTLAIMVTSKEKVADSLDIVRDKYSKLVNINYSVGANTRMSSNSKDNSWGMWIYASVPMIIDSFKVKAENDGNIVIGVYDAYGQLLSERNVNVIGNKFVIVNPDFLIPNNGYYYLCITQANNNTLSYHVSSEEEFQTYRGLLDIIGCCSKRYMKDSSAMRRTDYYQYFYDIKYKIIDQSLSCNTKE